MENTTEFSVTPEQVTSRQDMAVAIAKVVSAAGDARRVEDAVIDMVSEALTLYHDLGRADFSGLKLLPHCVNKKVLGISGKSSSPFPAIRNFKDKSILLRSQETAKRFKEIVTSILAQE